MFDASGGSRTSTGNLGYDRLSQYLYAPIGARIDPVDKLSIKAQYNFFLIGNQTSYLSTASSAFSDISNEQKGGGCRYISQLRNQRQMVDIRIFSSLGH